MQNSSDIFEMRTEINLNNSTVYFSEMTELPNDDKETPQWFNEEITRLIQL